MGNEAVRQFVEIARQHYYSIQIGELERQEILLNIAQAELDNKITQEQAKELRKYYQVLKLV